MNSQRLRTRPRILDSANTNETVSPPAGQRECRTEGVDTSRMTGPRRIPPFAEDALAVLQETVGDDDEGLLNDEATAVLVADERFAEADAEYALDVLQSRGYIYYVDEQVYITPTDD